MTTLLMIGTRKGLFLARSNDRVSWSLDGPHFSMNSVYATAIDPRPPAASNGSVRLLAGGDSEHWGPSVFRSDDYGASWQETEGRDPLPDRDRRSPGADVAARPRPADEPDVVYAGVEPAALFRSDDGGRLLARARAVGPPAPAAVAAGRRRTVPAHRPPPSRPTRPAADRHLGRRGLPFRRRRRDVAGQQPRASSPASSPTAADPEFGQCVHKVARDAGDPERSTSSTTAASTAATTAAGRGAR